MCVRACFINCNFNLKSSPVSLQLINADIAQREFTLWLGAVTRIEPFASDPLLRGLLNMPSQGPGGTPGQQRGGITLGGEDTFDVPDLTPMVGASVPGEPQEGGTVTVTSTTTPGNTRAITRVAGGPVVGAGGVKGPAMPRNCEGRTLKEFRFTDENPKIKKMYKDCTHTHGFRVRGGTYMKDKRKVGAYCSGSDGVVIAVICCFGGVMLWNGEEKGKEDLKNAVVVGEEEEEKMLITVEMMLR